MYDELVKRLMYCRNNAAIITDEELVEIADEAADAIEELSKPRWIPVTERLPRMWEEVMLRFPNNQAVGFHDGDSGWAVFSGDNLYTYVTPEEVHPTHWKPKGGE